MRVCVYIRENLITIKCTIYISNLNFKFKLHVIHASNDENVRTIISILSIIHICMYIYSTRD